MNILINYSNVKVVILDSQGINYNLYNDVCEVVNKEEDIIVKINLLRREFEDRVKNNTRDKMVVFIDEIYEILKLDNSVKDDINYLLEEIKEEKLDLALMNAELRIVYLKMILMIYLIKIMYQRLVFILLQEENIICF